MVSLQQRKKHNLLITDYVRGIDSKILLIKIIFIYSFN